MQWVVQRSAQVLRQPDFAAASEAIELLPAYLETLSSVSPFGPPASEHFFVLLDTMIAALMGNLARVKRHVRVDIPPAVNRALGYVNHNTPVCEERLTVCLLCSCVVPPIHPSFVQSNVCVNNLS